MNERWRRVGLFVAILAALGYVYAEGYNRGRLVGVWTASHEWSRALIHGTQDRKSRHAGTV